MNRKSGTNNQQGLKLAYMKYIAPKSNKVLGNNMNKGYVKMFPTPENTNTVFIAKYMLSIKIEIKKRYRLLIIRVCFM